MKLDIHFRHMDRSDSLEDLATDKVMHAVDGYLHRHDVHVQIWLISDLNLNNRGTGSFICEIEVRSPKKKHFFITKRDIDMHVAIQAAADKMKILLDNSGKRELDMRHQQRAVAPGL
jgi:ribosome-associated translation inhibitor RaiA